MSNRSWFFASQGQQQGPYPEAQLRALIVRGTVTADTLVWSEGMADWQKAGNIPGLLSDVSGALTSTGGQGGGTLTIDVGLWELLGRGLVFVIGFLLVIPAPGWRRASTAGSFPASVCRSGPTSPSPAKSATSGTSSARWRFCRMPD